jgi:hypothetical protein
MNGRIIGSLIGAQPLALLLTALAVPAAFAQFDLFVVDGNVEHAVPTAFDLGSLYAGESASAHFRLRNTSSAPATVTVLQVAGAGFTLNAPTPPLALAPQAVLDFIVTFSAADTGGYSAALRSDGVSVLLTATVLPRLTYLVDTGAGLLPLGPAPAGVDFGTALRGAIVIRHILIQNRTSLILTVPAIAVPAGDFSLPTGVPSGAVLQPLQASAFDVQFTPAAAGARSGSLGIGDRTYPLSGAGQDPPLPRPTLAIDLKQPASLQQGTVTVRFDSPALAAGSGTVTLAFEAAATGATDPAIVFASGGRTAPFAVSPGDTQAAILFQTGTTAGIISFAVQLGGVTDRQAVTIPAAPVGVSTAQGLRSTGTVEVRITGFDNTRTLSQLTFTFYDAAGNALAPAITTDATKDFAQYFQTADSGGVFLLRAVFPVTGAASAIASFDVGLTNSAATAKTAHTVF